MLWSSRTSRAVGRIPRAAAIVVASAGTLLGFSGAAAAEFRCPPEPSSTVEQIVASRRADVMTARLTNGVVVHHRLMPDAGFTIVAGTLTPGFDDDAIGSAAARAAETALAADDRATGLKVNVLVVEQVLMVVVRGTDERIADMCALVAKFASEPVEFEPPEPGAGAGGGSARSVVRRTIDAVLDQRPVVIKPALDSNDGATTRRWPDVAAPGSLEVAVVGGAPFAEALLAADAALGRLPARQAPVAAAPSPPVQRASQVLTIQSSEMNLPEGREAVAVGLLVRNGDTLTGQRTIALAASLLRLRLNEGAPKDGATEVRFIPRGLRPGSAVITATAACPTGEGGPVATRFQEALRALATPAPAQEFERARAANLDQARQLMGDAMYWAGALAACSTRGYTPDELVALEPDLKAITPEQVASVMAAAIAQSGAITIYVREPGNAPGAPRPTDTVGQP